MFVHTIISIYKKIITWTNIEDILYYLNNLLENSVFKQKKLTMNHEVYNIYISIMYVNNSTKVVRGKLRNNIVRFFFV